MIPFSTEKLSVGNPAMFHARVLTGSPKLWIREKSSEHGIPFFLTSFTHCCTWSCHKQIYTQYILWNFEGLVRFMVFNATFNNIWFISWQVTDKLYHMMFYQAYLTWAGFKLTTLVVIGTDCIGSYKSNYNTITIPQYFDGSRQ